MSGHSHSMESPSHVHPNDHGNSRGGEHGRAIKLLEANRAHWDSVAEEHGGYDGHPIVIAVTKQVAEVRPPGNVFQVNIHPTHFDAILHAPSR